MKNEMMARVAAGLDPLTGEKMETVGVIRWAFGPNGEDLHKSVDDTGRKVTLNGRGTWVYSTEE